MEEESNNGRMRRKEGLLLMFLQCFKEREGGRYALKECYKRTKQVRIKCRLMIKGRRSGRCGRGGESLPYKCEVKNYCLGRKRHKHGTEFGLECGTKV